MVNPYGPRQDVETSGLNGPWGILLGGEGMVTVLERPVVEAPAEESQELEGLRERALTLIYDEGLRPADVARRLFQGAEFSDGLRDTLVQIGLGVQINGWLDQARAWQPEGSRSGAEFRGKYKTLRIGGRIVTSIFDRAAYEGADGMMKPLRDFTLEDLKALARNADTKAKGWEKLRDWADNAHRAMKEARVKTLGQLPGAKRKVLEEAWSA